MAGLITPVVGLMDSPAGELVNVPPVVKPLPSAGVISPSAEQMLAGMVNWVTGEIEGERVIEKVDEPAGLHPTALIK